MTIREAVERFLKSCETGGKAASTLRHYRSRLGPLMQQLGDRTWEQVKKIDLLEWLQAVNRDRSNSTQRANATVLMIFHRFAVKWLELDGKLKADELDRPACGERQATLTEEQTSQLVARMPADAALLYRALRLSGVRPNELVSATIEEITARDGVPVLVKTRHKTAKATGQDKVIPLGEAVLKVIREASGDRTSGPIFLRSNGEPWTVTAISRAFRLARRALGLPEAIVLYCARHEFASAVVDQHGIHKASKLLGHRSIQTTQRYAHAKLSDLAAVQNESMRDISSASQPSHDRPEPAGSTDLPVGRPGEPEPAGGPS